jgi:hypothetical protein
MMADETSAAQAFAGLAMSASLMEALLKRGLIEQADVDAIMGDAASNVAAFCTDRGPEVEREALQVLELIGKSLRDVVVPEPAPAPVTDPASS